MHPVNQEPLCAFHKQIRFQFQDRFRNTWISHGVMCVAAGHIHGLSLAVNWDSALSVWRWGSKLSVFLQKAKLYVILCPAWSRAVPERVLVALCKFSLTSIMEQCSCACRTMLCGFWKAFVTACHSCKKCFLLFFVFLKLGPVKYLFVTDFRWKAWEWGDAFHLLSTDAINCAPFSWWSSV